MQGIVGINRCVKCDSKGGVWISIGFELKMKYLNIHQTNKTLFYWLFCSLSILRSFDLLLYVPKIFSYIFSQRATKDVYSCMKKGRLSFFTEQSSMHKKTRTKSNTQNSTKTQRQQTFRINYFVCFPFVLRETVKYIYPSKLKYYKK